MCIGIVRADLGSLFKQRGRIVIGLAGHGIGAEGNQRIEVSWCFAEQPLQQPIGAVGSTESGGPQRPHGVARQPGRSLSVSSLRQMIAAELLEGTN